MKYLYRLITAKFKDFTVELDSVTCYEHGTDVDGESAMEINCIRPMASHTLRITLAENVNSPLVLCEVEVYRGTGIPVKKKNYQRIQ